MPKVLQSSPQRLPWEGKVVTCLHCRCVFELIRGDNVREYEGVSGAGIQRIINCPECHQLNSV